MVNIITDLAQDVGRAIGNSRIIGAAAQRLYGVKDAIFGADVTAAEKALTDEKRFEIAREKCAQCWREN